MIPWERDTYISLIITQINEENEKIKRIFVISIGSESEFCIEKMQQVGAKISNVLNGFELTGATLLPLFASQNQGR